MKRRDPVLLGDVMRQFLDPAALDDNANQQRLVAFWPDVVGEYINRQTVRRLIPLSINLITRMIMWSSFPLRCATS